MIEDQTAPPPHESQAEGKAGREPWRKILALVIERAGRKPALGGQKNILSLEQRERPVGRSGERERAGKNVSDQTSQTADFGAGQSRY